jgi:hypothetical protein
LATAWIIAGLLRPFADEKLRADESSITVEQSTTAEVPMFAALRNTLAALIGLFAIYLVFEFRTLWFREFPKGFYYAGYAHQGAAWLTAALALATFTLSLIFRGEVLNDPRLPRLKQLAWIWSGECLVLALTVFNRLHIYVQFNGMTRMRTVALFGTSAVVAGLVLVIWKIVHRRDFAWLIRRDLWALAIAVYLYSLTPVDWLVHTYNVRRILAGELAPVVQMTEHDVNNEGILAVAPLARCSDPVIRDGVRALLAERAADADREVRRQQAAGWTAHQISDRVLRDKLAAARGDWNIYADRPAARQVALERFRKYAYQWY